MQLNIINLEHRFERIENLRIELNNQNITDFKIWKGIIDKPICKGISKAHKQIVQYAKDNGLNEVLICEDDLQFSCKDSFKYFLDNKPKEYDIYLGNILDGVLNPDSSVNFFTGTVLYMVHSKFYDTFLSIDENKYLDTELGSKGKCFVCVPMVACQRQGYSDNVKKIVDYSKYNSLPLLKE